MKKLIIIGLILLSALAWTDGYEGFPEHPLIESTILVGIPVVVKGVKSAVDSCSVF